MLGNIGKYWKMQGNIGKYREILKNIGKCWEATRGERSEHPIGKYWAILGSDKGRAKRAPNTAARAAERSEAANASCYEIGMASKYTSIVAL